MKGLIMKYLRFTILIIIAWFFVLETADSQEARQWVARFTGTQKKVNDIGKAIMADDSGYVYVAGSSARKSTGVDFVVIKYDLDGTLMWSAYYNGPGKGIDEAISVVIDTGYNVYVTGPSQNASGNYDYATVKYDRNGVLLWSVRFDGTASGDDQPIGVAVNDSLNVYVTGSSRSTGGAGVDIATVKYNRDGVEQWVKYYTGPGHGNNSEDKPYAMQLRGTTELYVTGASSDNDLDYITIKYSPLTGDTIWTARFVGAGGGDDVARALYASSSAVFVTGYTNSGANGNDYYTIRYDPVDGTTTWAAQYNGTANGDDRSFSIGVSGSSRVFVTGRSLQTGSYYDITTINYAFSNGTENWVSSYNGSANDNDSAVAVNSTPYVIGSSTAFGVKTNYTLIKYSANNGTESFNTLYNGTGNSYDVPAAFATSNGNVFVTGKSSPDGKTYDIVTIKYADSKKLKYRSFIQDSLAAKAKTLKTTTTVPNMGNVRDAAFASAFPKIKSGFPGAPGGLVLGIPTPENASSVGWIRITKSASIIKFAPHTGTARNFDSYGGKPFIGEKKDPKLTSYNNKLTGELLALKLNIGASDAEVTPPTFGDLTYLGLDTVGGLPLTDLSLRQLATLTDNFLTYADNYGQLEWDTLYNVLHKINQAFLGPMKFVSNTPLVMTGAVHIDSVLFLSSDNVPAQTPTTMYTDGVFETQPTEYSLNQNYPNPFNPTTTVSFVIGNSSLVSLKVYDMLGREVATLLNDEYMDAGQYEAPFDGTTLASGVYFYRLNVLDAVTGEVSFTDVKRMVMIK